MNTHFLLNVGDLLTSSSMLTLGNVQENLTLHSLTRIGVHDALAFAQTFIILEKLFNRVLREKT
jgi:hypothetical protein